MRFFKLIIPVLALAASGTMLAGCDDDKGADYINEFYTVERAEWSLNEASERYEVFFRNPNIDNWMYEYGLSDGYVWLNDTDATGSTAEVRKQLPYTYTVYYGDSYYDLTFDYDISKGYIGFFIRTIPEIIPRSLIQAEIDFKVALMYR